jgi:hypothetical protein
MYRPRRESDSPPPPNSYTGDFTPNRISIIAQNAARSGDSFAEASRTLPPLMIGMGGRRLPPFRLQPAPPRDPYTNLVSVHPDFDGETDVNRKPFLGDQVERVAPERLERIFAVRFGPDGILRGRGNRPFQSSTGTAAFGQDPRAIFVMDSQGRIYATNHPAPGEFHHSSLGNDVPVAAAGELSVSNGRINFITAASGHYRPQRIHMLNVKLELERQGILDVPIYDHKGPAGGNVLYVTGLD